jgi:hypothetical protein
MNQHSHSAEELDELKGRLLTMGRLAEERLRLAIRGLVERNTESLTDVVAGDSVIDDLQMEIDNRCFTLMALSQPVATDLRTVLSTLKINADLERVGDLAVKIGQVAQRYLRYPPVKPLIDLPRMGQLGLFFSAPTDRPAPCSQAAPSLRLSDRILCGFGSLFLNPERIRKPAIYASPHRRRRAPRGGDGRRRLPHVQLCRLWAGAICQHRS